MIKILEGFLQESGDLKDVGFSLRGRRREERCSSQPDCDAENESKTDGERFQVVSDNTQGTKGPEISTVCSVSVDPSFWEGDTFNTF